MTLGERMLQYRAKKGLTQVELAELLETNSMMVWRCETGRFKLHRVNEIRLTNKMEELERNE
jgi:transcriptional regulator with XRE-family HTH domain